MTIAYSGDSITFPDNSVQNTAATGFGFKNRIINGAMVIDQRNAGAAVSAGSTFPIDRFQAGSAGSQTWTMQRSTTTPSGFSNSVAVVIGTGGAPAATDRLTLTQPIEGYNTADFSFGSASAQSITMSFWVRSSLTGAFGVAFRNGATNRAYVASYSVLAANTWEYKSFTIAGDTSGTWAVDNTAGIYVNFDLGCGTTFSTTSGSWQAGNFLGLTGGTKLNATSGATFYITGVQLEKGSTATSFDYRPYGTELALCQRYYQTSYLGSAVGSITTTGQLQYTCSTTFGYNGPTFTFQAPMRATATITSYSPSTGASGKCKESTVGADITVAVTNGTWSGQIYANNVSTVGGTNLTMHYTASAEL